MMATECVYVHKSYCVTILRNNSVKREIPDCFESRLSSLWLITVWHWVPCLVWEQHMREVSGSKSGAGCIYLGESSLGWCEQLSLQVMVKCLLWEQWQVCGFMWQHDITFSSISEKREITYYKGFSVISTSSSKFSAWTQTQTNRLFSITCCKLMMLEPQGQWMGLWETALGRFHLPEEGNPSYPPFPLPSPIYLPLALSRSSRRQLYLLIQQKMQLA